MMTLKRVDILVSQIILNSLITHLNCSHMKNCKKSAMDTLIKLFISLISVNFINLMKPSVYCRLDECIRSSVDLLIKDFSSEMSLLLYFKERRRRPVVTF